MFALGSKFVLNEPRVNFNLKLKILHLGQFFLKNHKIMVVCIIISTDTLWTSKFNEGRLNMLHNQKSYLTLITNCQKFPIHNIKQHLSELFHFHLNYDSMLLNNRLIYYSTTAIDKRSITHGIIQKMIIFLFLNTTMLKSLEYDMIPINMKQWHWIILLFVIQTLRILFRNNLSQYTMLILVIFGILNDGIILRLIDYLNFDKKRSKTKLCDMIPMYIQQYQLLCWSLPFHCCFNYDCVLVNNYLIYYSTTTIGKRLLTYGIIQKKLVFLY